MEKYTKKASARILKEVLKVNPKASGFTTLDQAFVILMTEWDMEMNIEESNNITTCTLIRDDDKPKTWEFKDAWDWKLGDWDWNTIYKTVLEDIIKGKLYKRPKLGKRALKKIEKEKAEIKAKEEKLQKQLQVEKDRLDTFESLKRRKGNLQVKKSDWKKKGKDISGIEKEIEDINIELQKLSKTK